MALRISALAPSANGPPSPLNEPTDVKICVTSGMSATKLRALSAASRVSSNVEPGCNSNLMAVCPKSLGGENPVGNKGTTLKDAINNISASKMVTKRCLIHHLTTDK